eukprot:535445_1
MDTSKSNYGCRISYKLNTERLIKDSVLYPIRIDQYIANFKVSKRFVSEKVQHFTICMKLCHHYNERLVCKDKRKLTVNFHGLANGKQIASLGRKVCQFEDFVSIFDSDIFIKLQKIFNIEFILSCGSVLNQNVEYEHLLLQNKLLRMNKILKDGDVKVYYMIDGKYADDYGMETDINTNTNTNRNNNNNINVSFSESEPPKKKRKIMYEKKDEEFIVGIDEDNENSKKDIGFLRCDKYLLTSETLYFDVLLNGNKFDDSMNDCIHIPVCKEQALSFIKYLTSGIIDKNMDCLKMLKLADNYNMSTFKQALIPVIINDINIRNYVMTANAWSRLKIADGYSTIIQFGKTYLKKIKKKGRYSELVFDIKQQIR